MVEDPYTYINNIRLYATSVDYTTDKLSGSFQISTYYDIEYTKSSTDLITFTIPKDAVPILSGYKFLYYQIKGNSNYKYYPGVQYSESSNDLINAAMATAVKNGSLQLYSVYKESSVSIRIKDLDGEFVPIFPIEVNQGGTGLNISPSMLVRLDSTSSSNIFQKYPRPGVTGTLPISNGGTGSKTAAAALTALGAASATDLSSVQDSVSRSVKTLAQSSSFADGQYVKSLWMHSGDSASNQLRIQTDTGAVYYIVATKTS